MKLTTKQLRCIIREEINRLVQEENLEEGWKELVMGLGLLAGMAGSSPAHAGDDAPASETTKQTMQVDQTFDASGIQFKVTKSPDGGYDINVSKDGDSAGTHVDGDLDDAKVAVMKLKVELLRHLNAKKAPSKSKTDSAPSSVIQRSKSDW